MNAQTWYNIKQGDQQAMMLLYKESYQDLYAFGFRICANKEQVKDCIHEMFCEIWQKRHALAEVQQVKAYLRTYLKRKLLKEIYQNHNHEGLTKVDEGIGKEKSYESLLIEAQESDEKKKKLWLALDHLTKNQREIIKLKFYEGLNYEQIASALNLQPRTVYNHVYEALQVLRKLLKSFIIFFFFLF
ncbi:RNA polymerase sigma factor [Pedobacter glucosidilyticus]|uniref:RNA polymerase sigma factor n=1 Tax=Pedobacter glucosidilyticus TaxID=1122941 RepID=UPI0026EFFB4C|nr:sigma-70 family RNA polymerase sigma factor [Pedobacter glucosidilyticus]